MGDFPSGQRGQTVNLLATPSVVRIHHRPLYADVAQLAEQLICNQQVIGSSPIIGLTIRFSHKFYCIILYRGVEQSGSSSGS